MEVKVISNNPKELGSNNLIVQNKQKNYFENQIRVDKTTQADTVQLSNKKNTMKKIGIVAAVLTSSVGLFLLFKGTKHSKQVIKNVRDVAKEITGQTTQKTSLKEAENTVQNAARETAQKTAEEAKIAAEKAKQEAAQKAAEEAKIAAEKAKQEAAQKAAEEAKIAAEKLHQKAMTALDDVSKKYTTSEIDWSLPFNKLEGEILGKYNDRLQKTTSVTNEMISVLAEAEKNGTNISVTELKKALANAMTSPDGLEKLSEKLIKLKTQKFGEFYEQQKKLAEETIKNNPKDNFDLNELIELRINGTLSTIGERVQYIGNKNEYLKRIINRIETTPKAEQQKTSEYLKEIISAEIKSEQAKKAAFNSQIKSMLKYTDDTSVEPIELTQQERQELADYFNKLFGTNEFNADTNMANMTIKWKNKYISGCTPDLPDRTERALMRLLGRACPDEYYKNFPTNCRPDFEHVPLSRWMKIFDIKGFLKQFENPGSEYSYSKLQSFSKNFNQGENQSFTDWGSCYNVKLIVHPKSNSGKTFAADMGTGKYGDMEAVYPKGQKFKFLGKTQVMSSSADFPYHDPFDAFYRWEIHLQEI